VTIHLGVASFLHELEELGIEVYLPNKIQDREKTSLTITAPNGGKFPFGIFPRSETRTECGYILTNEKVLSDLFGKDAAQIIRRSKRSITDGRVKHCSSKPRGYTIELDEEKFSCKH